MVTPLPETVNISDTSIPFSLFEGQEDNMLYKLAVAAGGKAQIHGERPVVRIGKPASLLFGCVPGPGAAVVWSTSCCRCCRQRSDPLYPEINVMTICMIPNRSLQPQARISLSLSKGSVKNILCKPAATAPRKAQIHGERPALRVGEPARLLCVKCHWWWCCYCLVCEPLPQLQARLRSTLFGNGRTVLV